MAVKINFPVELLTAGYSFINHRARPGIHFGIMVSLNNEGWNGKPGKIAINVLHQCLNLVEPVNGAAMIIDFRIIGMIG